MSMSAVLLIELQDAEQSYCNDLRLSCVPFSTIRVDRADFPYCSASELEPSIKRAFRPSS